LHNKAKRTGKQKKSHKFLKKIFSKFFNFKFEENVLSKCTFCVLTKEKIKKKCKMRQKSFELPDCNEGRENLPPQQ
jgi:hypothetical protein